MADGNAKNLDARNLESLTARMDRLEQRNRQLEQDNQALTARVRDLADREEIRKVLNLYTRSADRFDWRRMSDVFHDDAILDHNARTSPVKDYWPKVEEFIRSQWSTCLHTVLNQSCDFDGDTAHVETYAIVFHLTNDDKTVLLLGARYIDRFERRDGKWKIALRRLAYEFHADTEAAPLREWHLRGSRDREDLSYMRPLKPSAEALAALAGQA